MADDMWDRAAAAATLRPGADPFENAVIGGSRPTTRLAQDIGDALKAGYQSESMGLILRRKLPDIEMGEDAPWYMRAAYGVGNVVSSLPAGIVGGVAGFAAGAPTGPIGAAVGAASGGFGVPMALRDALVAAYNSNSALSWEGVKDIGFAALKGGAKGAVIGAATGGAGVVAGRAIGAAIAPSVGATMTAQTAGRVIGGTAAGAELVTMTTGMAALDGRMPTYQDFLDGAILLGGLKAATYTAKSMMNVFSQTGKTPAEQVLDAQADPRLKAHLQDPAKNPIPEPYRQLALEERVKAALDTDQKPQLAKALAAEIMGKPDEASPLKAVRYEYITDRETAEAVVRAVVETSKADIESARRGVVPVTQSMAEGVALIKDGTLEGGPRAINSGEVAARAMLTKGAAERAWALMREWNALTPEQRADPMRELQIHAAFQQVGMFYKELAAGGAEAARAVNMLGQIKRNPELLGGAREMLDAYNRAGKDVGSLTKAIELIKDPMQLAKFASEVDKATTMEKVIAAFRAFIFSGPLTHLSNPIGGATKWLIDVPVSAVTGGLEMLRRSGTDNPMKAAEFKAIAFAPVIGWQLGGLNGIKAAADVWRAQGSFSDRKSDTVRIANEGVLGKMEGAVWKALRSEDMVFRVPAETAMAYKLAVQRALKEGFNPETKEGRAAIQRYTSTPQFGLNLETAQKITAMIEKAGDEAVFAQDLGKRMNHVKAAITGSPAQFLLPAFTAPVNLLSEMMQMTPGLNLMSARWRADWAAGGESRSRAAARIAVGGSLAMTAYVMAENGFLTGSGIYDKEQGGAKRAAGWQPNSLLIDGEYYSFERIEPVAKLLTLAADLVELAKLSKDDDDKAKIGLMLLAGFGNITVSTTYMSSLSDAIKAVTDPKREAENFFEGYAAALVPKIVGQPVMMADPYKREVDGVLDAIQSQLPFVRQKLLPKRDVWGEPMQNDRFFDVLPVATSKQSEDKVKTEAMRLQLAIVDAPRELVEKGPFKQTERDIKLTGEMRDVMREVSGKMALEILSPIVNAPDWDRIPDFAKAEVYKRVIERSRQQGALQALPPDSPERVQMRDKIVNKINEQFRAAEAR